MAVRERRKLLRLCGGSELSAGDPPIGPSTDAALAHYMGHGPDVSMGCHVNWLQASCTLGLRTCKVRCMRLVAALHVGESVRAGVKVRLNSIMPESI